MMRTRLMRSAKFTWFVHHFGCEKSEGKPHSGPQLFTKGTERQH